MKPPSSDYATKVEKKCERTKSARVKKLQTSDFSEIASVSPRMQTMDRRVSSSSDKIDTLRKQNLASKPVRTHSSSRLSYERKTQVDNDFSDEYDFVTGRIHRKCDIRSQSFHRSIPRTEEHMTKTPLALFLEDDGPYSRKLFGPLAQSVKEGKARGRQKEREIYQGNYDLDKERNIEVAVDVKKGTLWKQRDKLFARYWSSS